MWVWVPLHLGFWKWITMSDTSQGKYSQINVHVHIKNLLAFATTNNLRSLFLGENCAGFLKGARGYVGWGKASQSSIPSIPARSWAGAPSLQGYFPGVKKKTFPAVFRRLFSLRAGSLLFWVSLYGTAAYDIIGSRLWKKWLKPLVLPYTLVHCIPSFHTSILPSLPQCRIVFIRHTMLSLSVMLSPWRWAGARLLSWPPGPG